MNITKFIFKLAGWCVGDVTEKGSKSMLCAGTHPKSVVKRLNFLISRSRHHLRSHPCSTTLFRHKAKNLSIYSTAIQLRNPHNNSNKMFVLSTVLNLNCSGIRSRAHCLPLRCMQQRTFSINYRLAMKNYC